MKYLILLRHAKSSWKDLSLADHDRPLNKRGKRTAPIIGERLSIKNIQPQLIISSTAKRAIKTAEIVANKIACDSDMIETDIKLFHAMPKDICELISKCNNTIDRLMLVGHNPGFTYLANKLLNSEFFENIPTAGLLTISIEIDNWDKFLQPSIWRKIKLIDYDYPKLKEP